MMMIMVAVTISNLEIGLATWASTHLLVWAIFPANPNLQRKKSLLWTGLAKKPVNEVQVEIVHPTST